MDEEQISRREIGERTTQQDKVETYVKRRRSTRVRKIRGKKKARTAKRGGGEKEG
jgi:hypothetical protein